MELLRKMPHQNIGLAIAARVLSDSGQHCVDLSPIKNYNFGWGRNFIESPPFFGSDVFTNCSGRLHVVRMELLRKMPYQNLGLDRVLSDSGQPCVDLSPSQFFFGWGPNFYRVTIFFCSDVLQLAAEDYKLFGWNSCARCLTRTLGSIEFFLTQVNTV